MFPFTPFCMVTSVQGERKKEKEIKREKEGERQKKKEKKLIIETSEIVEMKEEKMQNKPLIKRIF